MKLSKSQLHVLKRMNEGWEFGKAETFSDGRCWLQQDGLGRGGKTEQVHANTAYSLWKKGLIKYVSGFPSSKAFLTELGKQALGD